MKRIRSPEVLELHERLISVSGGMQGVRDMNILESALEQPYVTFDGVDLYPSLIEKAGALGFSLIRNHAFLDGNKRIGQAVMEAFLLENGLEIQCPVDDQEMIVMLVASSQKSRADLTEWLLAHTIPGKKF